MSAIKQSLINKSDEVLAVLHTFPNCKFDAARATSYIVTCSSPEEARNVTQTINNKAIKGVAVITSVLFPMDVYIRFSL